MKLSIWQVNSYIEAAQIAIYLHNNSDRIPPNYSQAVDNLELQWRSIEPEEITMIVIAPKPISIEPVEMIKSVSTAIDRMRQLMYDLYFPKWRT